MILSGKVAIITGGTRGIGESIVCKFAECGAKVGFSYLNNNKKAKKIEKTLQEKDFTVKAYKNDVKDMTAMKKMVKDVKSVFGNIDIVVNNAGILRDGAMMLMDDQDWDDVLATNLTGTYNLTRAAIVSLLKQKSGTIINLSSVAGTSGAARQVNYSSSKAGIIGLTKALAKEVGKYNIRVNAIAPGYIETDMTRNIKKEKKEALTESIPLKRFGKSPEVADLALFLASESSSYITGQVIVIDGGLTI